MRAVSYTVVGLTCLLATGCGGERFSTAPSTTSSTSGNTSSNPAASVSDSAALHDDAITGADLGRDWSVTSNESKADPPSASDCAPGAVLPRFTAEENEELSYGRHPGGSEAGHMTVILSASRTAADVAQRIRTVERRSNFQECVRVGVIEDAQSASGRGGSVESAVTAPIARPSLASITNSYRTIVQYHFAGQAKLGFVDQFYLERGRAIAVVVFRTCCKPFPETFEVRALALLDTRLKHDFAR